MSYHKLLQKQIKQVSTEFLLQHPEIKELLSAVNDSYNAYERDAALASQALKIKEENTIDEWNGRIHPQDFKIEHQTEEKYRSIIAKINLGLMEVDKEEIIQFANQNFCVMSGYPLDELIGKNASNLFTTGKRKNFLQTKNEKEGICDAYEISTKNKKGEVKWWVISGAPRYNEKLDLIGSIRIHLDVTQQKTLELELINARVQADTSVNAKQHFLANMSHEIRTPMNAILGMTNQLGKTKLNKDQHFYLDTINSATDSLLVIINDILDLSKIDAGKLVLEKVGLEPRAIVNIVMQVMSHKAEEKGLNFTNSFYDSRLSTVLLGDPYRLKQVLLNLVSNAIKFTKKGSVDVTCEILADLPTYQTIELTVSDTGIGMDESFADQLFDKFSQEDTSIIRTYGGTGLGMSICKELIDLMKGHIRVESKKGSGTSVSIIVDLQKGTKADLPNRDEVAPDISLLKGKKILVADDNEMNQLVAATILRNYGAEITKAFNGVEAVEKIGEIAFDMVLMDVQMPVMDGIEATKVIRETFGDSIPVIALTASAIIGDNDKCIQAGMNDYLSKPFKENQLLQIVSKWLGKSLPKQEIVVQGVKNKDKLFNLAKLNEITRGNKAFVSQMIKLFIEQAPLSVLEMETAVIDLRFDIVKKIIKGLRPATENINIPCLITVLDKMDAMLLKDTIPVDFPRLVKQLELNLKEVIFELNDKLKVFNP